MFVLDTFGRCALDACIWKDSKFYYRLKLADEVAVDKGFHLKEDPVFLFEFSNSYLFVF